MGAQRAGPLRGDKYPLAASECTTVSPLGQVLSIELSIDYRIPAAQRPGAAARQSPAGTRVSSPPSALRIARAVVQALTTARAARAPWDRCVAAVSAATPRTGCPPPARRRASRGTRRAAPSREPRKAGSGIGVRGCAAAHTQSVTHTGFVYILTVYEYVHRYRSRRAVECFSVLRACGVTRHRLRRILSSAGIARRESGGVYYARAA
jgi:hypothetical protein